MPMWNSVLMDAIEWLNWRGLVDRPFVYTCFFPHHQTQVQGNKKGKKKKKKTFYKLLILIFSPWVIVVLKHEKG